jgi:hypothetical protein
MKIMQKNAMRGAFHRMMIMCCELGKINLNSVTEIQNKKVMFLRATSIGSCLQSWLLGRWRFRGLKARLAQEKTQDTISQITKAKMTECVAQIAEWLPSKLKAKFKPQYCPQQQKKCK